MPRWPRRTSYLSNYTLSFLHYLSNSLMCNVTVLSLDLDRAYKSLYEVFTANLASLAMLKVHAWRTYLAHTWHTPGVRVSGVRQVTSVRQVCARRVPGVLRHITNPSFRVCRSLISNNTPYCTPAMLLEACWRRHSQTNF